MISVCHEFSYWDFQGQRIRLQTLTFELIVGAVGSSGRQDLCRSSASGTIQLEVPAQVHRYVAQKAMCSLHSQDW